MNAIGNINVDLPFMERRFTTCHLHGSNVEALMNGDCKACADYKEEQQQQRKYERKILQQKEEYSEVPPLFLGANLDNYVPSNIRAEQLLKTCRDYEFDRNFMLLGMPGNGKTHLGCALIDKAIRQGKNAKFVLFRDIQKAEKNFKDVKIYKTLTTINFLVIDEFELDLEEGNSQKREEARILLDLINRRYNNMAYTMILSNIAPAKIQESLSAPLYSRIKEKCLIRTTDWEDYRLTKGKV